MNKNNDISNNNINNNNDSLINDNYYFLRDIKTKKTAPCTPFAFNPNGNRRLSGVHTVLF